MATHYITIKGYIKNGELYVHLPDDILDAEVEVQIMIPDEMPDEAPLTDAEIAEFLRPKPGKTGAEIAQNPAIGSWADQEITDSVEWVNKLKRKRRERHQW